MNKTAFFQQSSNFKISIRPFLRTGLAIWQRESVQESRHQVIWCNPINPFDEIQFDGSQRYDAALNIFHQVHVENGRFSHPVTKHREKFPVELEFRIRVERPRLSNGFRINRFENESDGIGHDTHTGREPFFQQSSYLYILESNASKFEWVNQSSKRKYPAAAAKLRHCQSSAGGANRSQCLGRILVASSE